MPEGPSLVILKEIAKPFKQKKVVAVSGNTKEKINDLKGKKVTDFKTWGKHFLICFSHKTIRIHFLLFGSYTINGKKSSPARLSLKFSNGDLNFYACSVKIIRENLDKVYDWSRDVMNKSWNPVNARSSLKKKPDTLACDALLDQTIFSGVGNIIKNEVLFRIRLHPESRIGKLPPRILAALIREAHNYSFDFLKWKKASVLKKHWMVHTKKTCPGCKTLLVKKITGKSRRRSFFCPNCQLLY